MSEYYNHTTYPQSGSAGSAAAMRAELDSIEAGTDKLPVLAGNANKLVKVNSGSTALQVSAVISEDGTNATITGDLFITGGDIGQNSGQKHIIPLVASDTLALLAATQTITNKTVNLLNNTLTGTLAQFNTALSDADLVTTETIQLQTNTALTTTGTSTAFVATPAAAITANTTNQRFNVTFHVAPTGAPTIAYSGQTALNLKMYDGGGALVAPTAAYVPLGWRTDVITVGTDAIIQNQFKPIPAFTAIATISQSVTTSVATKVTMGAENFDTNNNFDLTLSRHTPTVAGFYQYTGVVRVNATNLTAATVSLYKNGVLVRQGSTINTAAVSAAQHLVVTELIQMNGTTDFMELFGTVIGTTPSFDYISTAQNCAFSGFLVRAA